jgi:hypothetical protein
MNYRRIYDELISRARMREAAGYVERHHIVPKCIGGDNSPDNLVTLTPEEHYVAHQLLVKIYPDHAGIAWAAIAMTAKGNGNKLYGWLRRRYSLSRVGSPRFWMRGDGNPSRSEAVRQKISQSKKGTRRKPFSKQWLQNLSASHKRHAATADYVPVSRRPGAAEKIGAAMRGRKWITDGAENHLVHVTGDLPDGWRLGRIERNGRRARAA